MRTLFQGTYGLIMIEVNLTGPSNTVQRRLILDTGSTETVISRETAEAVGFDMANPLVETQLSTASGVVTAPSFRLPLISALGWEIPDLQVIAHDMPATAQADGVLGLNFFRRMRLTIDFHREEILLESPLLPSLPDG